MSARFVPLLGSRQYGVEVGEVRVGRVWATGRTWHAQSRAANGYSDHPSRAAAAEALVSRAASPAWAGHIAPLALPDTIERF